MDASNSRLMKLSIQAYSYLLEKQYSYSEGMVRLTYKVRCTRESLASSRKNTRNLTRKFLQILT